MSRSPCGSGRQPFQVKNVQRDPEGGSYVVGTPPRKRQVPADDVHMRNLPEYASGKRSRMSRARDLAKEVESPAATTLRIDHSTRLSREERYQREFHKAQSQRQWKEAFIKAFPKLVFYLDHVDSAHKTQFTRQITQLGGHVDAFFSRSVTHVVTTRPIPILSEKENKQPSKRSRREPTENATARATACQLTSGANANMPVHSDRNPLDDTTPSLPATDLLCKAQGFGMKIWRQEKLQTILSLLLAADLTVDEHPQDLSEMLHQEKFLGTSERDPAAQRNDYHYFGKHCYYVLVTDATNEHRPILIQEYDRNAHEAQHKPPPWPVLYGDVEGRGLFTYSKPKDRHRLAMQDSNLKPAHSLSLRRVASLNMTGSQLYQGPNSSHTPGTPNLMASDNSIALASTVASTTSTSLHSQGTHSHAAAVPGKRLAELTRRMHAPSDLQKQASRGAMVRRMLHLQQTEDSQPKLRRAHSMTSARDPFKPREKKPGHCENCRCKFEDFDEHTRSRRHRKFAMDENNFVALDELLQRVQREPIEHGSWDDYAPMYQQDPSVTSSVLDEDMVFSADWAAQGTGVEHGVEYVAGSDIDGEPFHELQDRKAPMVPDLLDTTSTPVCNIDETIRVPTTTMNHNNPISGSTERGSQVEQRSPHDESYDNLQPIPTVYEISTNLDMRSNPSVCTVLDDLGKDQDSSTKDVSLSHLPTDVATVERNKPSESELQMECKDFITTRAAASVPAVTVTCISSDPASVTAPDAVQDAAPVTTPVTVPISAPDAASIPASVTAPVTAPDAATNIGIGTASSVANDLATDSGPGIAAGSTTDAANNIHITTETGTVPVTTTCTTQTIPADSAIQDSCNMPSMIVPQPLKVDDREASQDSGHDAEYGETDIKHKIYPKVDQPVSNDAELFNSRLNDMAEHQHGSSLWG
ncbi:Cdc7p-Dbf4p kinase complex regulatory subunit [Malassezia yamatoensis]|uniref:Cdc7p-Dbf4p kinase complex regulatory subunit n=1 Tax=Malassezia yamatoensis TaxID=253288 RepID=A0AAJ5YY47_9BASI|nr:Cdc7p-Dbf4p kinase complex regulatory subunit [Malassezia yamatoensis]